MDLKSLKTMKPATVLSFLDLWRNLAHQAILNNNKIHPYVTCSLPCTMRCGFLTVSRLSVPEILSHYYHLVIHSKLFFFLRSYRHCLGNQQHTRCHTLAIWEPLKAFLRGADHFICMSLSDASLTCLSDTRKCANPESYRNNSITNGIQ